MSKSELTISRHIAAPPSAVWAAWSDPAKLAQWWIPAPIICRVDQLDLRPGGGFVTRMREEGATDFQPHVDGCFLAANRSEERRGGKECDSTFRSWWSPYRIQKKTNQTNDTSHT